MTAQLQRPVHGLRGSCGVYACMQCALLIKCDWLVLPVHTAKRDLMTAVLSSEPHVASTKVITHSLVTCKTMCFASLIYGVQHQQCE